MEAEAFLSQAAEMNLKMSPANNSFIKSISVTLYDIFIKRNRFEEAQTLFLRKVSILKLTDPKLIYTRCLCWLISASRNNYCEGH